MLAGERQDFSGKRQPHRIRVLLACFVASLLFFCYLCIPSLSEPVANTSAFNSTLDFGRIYTISHPDHYAKRDELFLIGQAANLSFSYVDAVVGSSIPREQLPYIVNANLKDGAIGCWRSHVNTWRRMIEDGVETALILEDDVDFDVSIRSQLDKLHLSLNQLQGVTDEEAKQERWAGNWDVLWLGTCYERKQEGLHGETWLQYEDESVPETARLLSVFKNLSSQYEFADDQKAFGGRRLLQKSVYPLCTVGYALRRTAALYLYYHTTRYLQEPVDNFMAGQDMLNMYTILPPLFAQWKTHGTTNSHIENENVRPQFFNPSIGDSHNLQKDASIRKHLKEFYDNL